MHLVRAMSHTATGEWKSFEIRMRRRRAERLVLRADVAIDAECFDDARALLDEAQKLWAGVPGIAEVESRLRAAETPPPLPLVPPRKTKRHLIAAVAAVILLFTIAGAGTVLHSRPALAHLDVEVTMQPLTSLPGEPTPVPAPSPPPKTAPASLAQDDEPPADSPVEARRDVVPEIPRASQLPEATSGRTKKMSDSAVQTAFGGIQTIQPIALAPEPAPEPVRLASAPPPSAAPAMSDAIEIEPPQDALIRGTLDSYADAYTRLDADAAQHVWPMVNRDALSRAFENLESQKVSLGDCRIQVDGASARARCAGTATWTPKVGGGERTDERSWTFELSKAAGRWQIVSARVQNR